MPGCRTLGAPQTHYIMCRQGARSLHVKGANPPRSHRLGRPKRPTDASNGYSEPLPAVTAMEQ
jgi:hypothetical protein